VRCPLHHSTRANPRINLLQQYSGSEICQKVRRILFENKLSVLRLTDSQVENYFFSFFSSGRRRRSG
jgi:hypothetical protein